MYKFNKFLYYYLSNIIIKIYMSLNQCHHQAQEIMFCMSENCQYTSPCVCRLCLHDHQTLILKRMRYFQEKIRPFFEITKKKTSLEQKIKRKYQEKRLKVIQQINKQELATLTKLNNIADQSLVQTITDLSQLKSIKINDLKGILNDQISSKDRIDIIDELTLFQNQLNNNENNLENGEVRGFKRVIYHPPVDNTPTKKNHLNQSSTTPNQTANNKPNNIKTNSAINEKESNLFQQILNMNSEEEPREELESKICGSFDEAKIFLDNKSNQTPIVSIQFKFNSKSTENGNFRKNITQFIDALGNLDKTTLLNIQIDKQCLLASWNLKKLEDKCLLLPSLNEFRLSYYCQDDNIYDFQKLKLKLKGNTYINLMNKRRMNIESD